jgi:hypothetical protein
MKGRAKNADRVSRNGPSRASAESPASPSQAMPRAANEPVGSRLIETMKPTVRTNSRRASRWWTALSRAR